METSQPQPELAIILPAFNEAAGIVETLTRLNAVLAAFPVTTEILVVDDGSTDGTGARAASLGARVLTHPWNRGYGAALKTGVMATGAGAIMIMDADSTYLPEAVPDLFAKLDQADMIVGERRLMSEGVTWIRRPGKWLLNRLRPSSGVASSMRASLPAKRAKCASVRSGRSNPGDDTSSWYSCPTGSPSSSAALIARLTRSQSSSPIPAPSVRSMYTRISALRPAELNSISSSS
jgi:glycosyltransferase involved in cell wall biosynthesis